MYLRHDDQGLREVTYVNLGSTQVPQYSYRVQEPLTAGNHWVDPARPTEHYWDLLSTTSAVTVPAGTYPNCLKVREHDVTTDGTAFYIFVWFAATVGIVRTETDTIDTTTGKLTLESHQDLLRTQFPPAAASVHRAPTPPQAVTRPRASGRTFGR
jgi:hypothetical protein